MVNLFGALWAHFELSGIPLAEIHVKIRDFKNFLMLILAHFIFQLLLAIMLMSLR